LELEKMRLIHQKWKHAFSVREMQKSLVEQLKWWHV
jgi:hypothetical protein